MEAKHHHRSEGGNPGESLESKRPSSQGSTTGTPGSLLGRMGDENGDSSGMCPANNTPPPDQVVDDLTSLFWQYQDPRSGQCRGPFSNTDMRKWFEQGAFQPDLLVNLWPVPEGAPFVPLRRLFPGGEEAFAVPPAAHPAVEQKPGEEQIRRGIDEFKRNDRRLAQDLVRRRELGEINQEEYKQLKREYYSTKLKGVLVEAKVAMLNDQTKEFLDRLLDVYLLLEGREEEEATGPGLDRELGRETSIENLVAAARLLETLSNLTTIDDLDRILGNLLADEITRAEYYLFYALCAEGKIESVDHYFSWWKCHATITARQKQEVLSSYLQAKNGLQKRTPLAAAAVNGHAQIVDFLLSAEADPEARDADTNTPLLLAATNGHEAIVQRLLAGNNSARSKKKAQKRKNKNGGGRQGSAGQANVDTANTENQLSALHVALANGHDQVVTQLLAAGANIRARENSRMTPLHVAASVGSPHCAQLIAAGAHIDARDKDGQTPLHYAACKGHLEVIKQLLAAGAEIEAQGQRESTPLFMAVEGNQEAAARALLDAGANLEARAVDFQTPLHWAASKGCSAMVQLLLDAGAEIEAQDQDAKSFTPLHEAAFCGKTDCARLLLARGANVHARSKDGWTPLHFAAKTGDLECIDLFLTAGADINAMSRDDTQMSPAHVAAKEGNEEALKLLFAAGADKQAKMSGNMTILHIAAHSGNASLIQYLTNLMPEVVNGACTNGRTPLHFATSNGDNETVEQLLAAGASTKIKDILRQTPLKLSKKLGHADITAQIKEARKEKAPCNVCGANTAQRCQRCMTTAFCSRSCLKSGWKAHKSNCTRAMVGNTTSTMSSRGGGGGDGDGKINEAKEDDAGST